MVSGDLSSRQVPLLNPEPRPLTPMRPLNVGMIGYGFMGRAHSNAYRQVSQFFSREYRPVLKACCARKEDKIKAFAQNWGYESYETDWKKRSEERRVGK